MGGLSTLRVNARWTSLRLSGLLFLVFLPNLCKKPGQKTPVRSQMARFGVFLEAPDPGPSPAPWRPPYDMYGTITDAHRARSLTCILIADNDAVLAARSSAHCSTHTTRYRHEWRGTYGGYIIGPVCVVGSTLAVP